MVCRQTEINQWEIMITKTSCQHCGVHIEFEMENAGETVPCPSCGKQTRLLLPSKPADSELPAKPSVPSPSTKEPQPIAAIRRDWFPIGLQAITTAAVVFIAIMFWRHEQRPGLEYNTFLFDGDITVSMGADRMHLMLAFEDHKPAITGDGHEIIFQASQTKPVMVAGLSDILERLGADGWSFVSCDNKNYLVSRPKGKWQHEWFSVSFRYLKDSQ
jgi:hypothetical protein